MGRREGNSWTSGSKRILLHSGKFFDGAELPIAFYYTDDEGRAERVRPGTSHRCIFSSLSSVSEGRAICFDAEAIECLGGKRSLGFSEKGGPAIEHFLSCGVPGKFKGERYMKTPQIAAEAIRRSPSFKAPARLMVFKRWDSLDESDGADVVTFFAPPDVLSGLFSLAHFEGGAPTASSPWGSGCALTVT